MKEKTRRPAVPRTNRCDVTERGSHHQQQQQQKQKYDDWMIASRFRLCVVQETN
jgi:hypothetical protein